MKSGKWYFTHIIVSAAALGGLISAGCRKENGIDNNSVIRTPYGVYASDAKGALYNTNNGQDYKIVFPADGVPSRALCVSGNSIMFVKYNAMLNPGGVVFLSTDGGENFNPVDYSVNAQAKWQSLILDVPSMGRTYLASTKGSGVEFSQDNGLTWEVDNSAAPGTSLPFKIQSFTQLKDGFLFGLDNTVSQLYVKFSKVAPWAGISSNTPLPAGNRYLSHINNTLLAADYSGAGGIYYSTDTGFNWTAYSGTPANQELLSIAAPFDQVVLAGTDSAGIYRLVGNTFQPSNNGLKPFTSVYAIAAKQDTYKNDVIKQYIYIATNNGLFRSEDLGQNWTLAKSGDYRGVY